MIIIEKLTMGGMRETSDRPMNIIRALQDEPRPGFLRTISIGEQGVMVHRGGELAVCIPLQELVRLAEEAEPRLTGMAAAQPMSTPGMSSLHRRRELHDTTIN